MQVNRKSWHFRLWRLGREGADPRPVDLCRYFWHIALIKVLLPLVLGFMILVGIATLAWVVWNNPLITVGVLVGAVVLIAIIVLLVKLGQHIVDKHKEKAEQEKLMRLSGQLPDKEPSPFWEYLKARKRKVCPLIVVVGDEQGAGDGE